MNKQDIMAVVKKILAALPRILGFYILIPLIVFLLLARPIAGAVRASEAACWWILLAAAAVIGLNWYIYYRIHHKAPPLIVFAHGILCLTITVFIEHDAFPGYIPLTAVLAAVGGYLALAFLFVLSFWFASLHSKAAHSAAVVIWVILFLVTCAMIYQVARDIESNIVDKDTWITVAGVAEMILLALMPKVVSSYRRSADRRRKSARAEGEILQIVGETRFDNFGDLVTDLFVRIRYEVNGVSYETKGRMFKITARYFGRDAFIGKKVTVYYDPANPADTYVKQIDRHIARQPREDEEAPVPPPV